MCVCLILNEVENLMVFFYGVWILSHNPEGFLVLQLREQYFFLFLFRAVLMYVLYFISGAFVADEVYILSIKYSCCFVKHVCVRVYVCACVYMCACVYVHACMYVLCMCICVYVFICMIEVGVYMCVCLGVQIRTCVYVRYGVCLCIGSVSSTT